MWGAASCRAGPSAHTLSVEAALTLPEWSTALTV
jgi:hypothetical protein